MLSMTGTKNFLSIFLRSIVLCHEEFIDIEIIMAAINIKGANIVL